MCASIAIALSCAIVSLTDLNDGVEVPASLICKYLLADVVHKTALVPVNAPPNNNVLLTLAVPVTSNL